MKVLGFLVAALGIAVALYVGLYLMLFLGIVEVIHACQAHPLNGDHLAWGIVRIIFANFVGYAIAAIGFALCGLFYD